MKIRPVLAAALFPVLASAQTVTNEEVASWYPRTVTSDKGTMVVHAPQIDGWTDFETLEAWSAFEITRTGDDKTWSGSVHYEGQTDTDIQDREVLLHDIEIIELEIKGLDEGSEEYALVRDAIITKSRTVPLDLVLEHLPENTTVASSDGLNTEPPLIFVSTGPALLLSIDTEPVWVPVDAQNEGGAMFIINANWDVLRVGESGPSYFCYEGTWLTADEVEGPWTWAASLPAAIGALPDNATWADARACLPADLDNIETTGGELPTVFYADKQAELLMLDGEPEWETIGGSGVEFASNSEQEIFRVDGNVFVLLSGRWFEASSLSGPWTFTSDLPDAFRQIPPEDSEDAHEMSYVRSSIPGTREAWEAALIASIPRKAEIQKGSESALELNIEYAGEPVFTKIETTDIEMAVNTSYQVFRYGGAYYLCHNATWLTGFGPEGPWYFAESIPEEFYAIPPSSPAYNVTFVKIEDSNDQAIEYSYTSGYEGAYVSDETVVYGTGYPSPAVTFTIAYGFYDGWWGYPYYPWPPTYGYGSWYDPDTGRYGESIVGYGPYGAAGSAAVYNPETGAYARGRAVWDGDELAGRGYAYNPNTDTSIARNRYVDYDEDHGWSESVARRGDEWRYTQSEWDDGRMTTEFETSYGTSGEVTREREGDTIVSEGTIEGENRSATFQGEFEDGQYQGTIQGSEGGSGDINRTIDDGTITGGSEFTKDGQTINTDVTRTAEGVAREIETSGGGQGVSFRSGDDSAFAYETGSGDMYAGRDGNVYKKTDDGWESVENPRNNASQATAGTQSRARGESQFSGVEALPEGGFAGGGASTQRSSTGTYGSRAPSYDMGTTRSSLERDYQSRQRGFDRYSQSRSRAGARSPGVRGGRRRR